MEKNSKLLSILIPTKNRYNTLIPVIKAILDGIDEKIDLEIVVQDNSTTNDTFIIFYKDFSDTRLSYFYSAEDISITENTINAIDNSVGKYLIFIGDDDLVSPYVYDIVKYIEQHNIDCLVYNPAYYWWSNVNFEKETFYHRKEALWIPLNQSVKLNKRDSSDQLNIMLGSGAGIFSGLPKFYHGILKRDVLVRIRQVAGTYLPGSSPDIAFSTAIALTIKEYYYINFPVSVFGAPKIVEEG